MLLMMLLLGMILVFFGMLMKLLLWLLLRLGVRGRGSACKLLLMCTVQPHPSA